ncbi:MAG: hypothetical protein PHU62_00610 [Bacteroidales bacterium]|jgi:DNA-directed RNA polymerase specialized sigma24 family protein|nr:hypothetical protein [Bacteroidales bacterium]MDD2204274.1 hypothetical protein [Bacteroidales bacterium]MDD3913155.1 hypothetical protein [Bacteroidales bacterium]MDD4633070.1 hypothetical protein [Bacteroidales bacterium]
MDNLYHYHEEICLISNLLNEKANKQHLKSNVFESIKKFVINNNGTIDDAEDVFQDSLVILYTKLKVYQTTYSSMSAVLYGIARNVWKQKLYNQQKSYQIQNVNLTITQDAEEEYIKNEKIELLMWKLFYKCVNKIGGDCLEVLMSKDKETRRKRYTYKKMVSQMVKKEPEYKILLSLLE